MAMITHYRRDRADRCCLYSRIRRGTAQIGDLVGVRIWMVYPGHAGDPCSVMTLRSARGILIPNNCIFTPRVPYVNLCGKLPLNGSHVARAYEAAKLSATWSPKGCEATVVTLQYFTLYL